MSTIKIKVLFLSLLVFSGCATGAGENQNSYFHAYTMSKSPYNVTVEKETLSVESGIIMGESFPMMAASVGLVGAAVASNQGFVNMVRGKFAAGQAFQDTAKRLSKDESGKELRLNLLEFQQYAIPQHLQAYMKFSSRFENEDTTYISAYACDFKLKPGAFTPSTEKNMLKEMIDYSMHHWSVNLSKSRSEGNELLDLQHGTIPDDNVICSYEIYVVK